MFKFKLEAIRSLRNNTEAMCQRELGIVLTKKNQLEQKYRELQASREEVLILMRPKFNEPLDLETLKNYQQYDQTIKKKQAQVEADLVHIEALIDQKKEALKEAVKERKILENLKAIQYEEYQMNCKKEEQQLVDELVAYKYSIKDKGE